jgi:hypothetical protein
MVRRDQVKRLGNAVASPTAMSVAACWSTRPYEPGRAEIPRRRVAGDAVQAGASDEPVEGLAERLETHWVVLQLGGANLGDVLDGEACARVSRWASGPTAAQLSKALRERWAASSPLVGAGVAVPHLPLAGAPVEAALVTLAAPLQGRLPTGVWASTVVVLLSPERDRGQPACIAQVARLVARPRHRARRVRRPVVAIERVAELEQIRKVLRSARRPRRALRRRAPQRAAGARR